MSVISVSGAGVEFGANEIFRNVTFTVGRGDRWGIVGRNGTGKTTLFKLLTRELQPSSGGLTWTPGVTISLLEQHRDFAGATTIWEAAASRFSHLLALEVSLAEQATALSEHGEKSSPAMLARYDKDLERFEREGGYTFTPRVDAVLDGLGFPPSEARIRSVDELSGGERGRLGLARQLVSPADVLLLDEPTNHLDLDTTRWLEQYLRNTDQTILLISHDRAFLGEVVDHILHFEGDSATAYSGGYAAFVTQRAERRLTQERAVAKQQKMIANEEDYIRRNLAGQNTKQAKGRRKRLERMPRLSGPTGDSGVMALRFDPAERGGDQVVVAEKATIGVAGIPLVTGFTTRVIRGERVGFIGPNGAGKSTLIRTLMGDNPVMAGELRLGGSVKAAHYRQDMTQVPLGETLFDIIQNLRPTWERGRIQGHLGRFGFSGDSVLRRAESLSGGERARVALAMMMLTGANLLVLDVESIEALEDALDEYEGTVVLISHDRALLRAVATRVWILHDGKVTDFDGSFPEWEVASAERAHAARVEAAEAEALRRVQEKKKIRPPEKQSAGSNRGSTRDAQKAVEDAEREVAKLEAEVHRISGTLEDPALYTKPDAVERAKKLGAELDRTRGRLDSALSRWEAATAALQELSRR
jgi:ATP-binding cassette, subfamily F, member 3